MQRTVLSNTQRSKTNR